MKTVKKAENRSNTFSVQLEAHPPERKSRSVVVGGVCCSTCCCCCCCLHSVGGLIGSAIISGIALKSKPPLPFSTMQNQAMSPYQKQAYPMQPPPAYPMQPVPPAYPMQPAYPANYNSIVRGYQSSTRIAVGLYWLILLPSTAIAALLAGEISLILVAVFLPAIQIALGLVMLILVNIMPLADRSAATKAIAKILAGTFIGTIAGIAILSILSMLFVLK